MREELLFNQVLEHAPSQRAAFLDGACGADTSLRQSVEALLQAHANPGGFLQSPVFGDDTLPDVDTALFERVGTHIGPYKLSRQIGEGGMGVVYMAEQLAPLPRTVALKLIKPGMDSRQVIARFAAERQALALMDHANIARVFDAGATNSGRPYIVMELVHGVPITKYCDHNRLSLRQRLQLFVLVCDAIQHAHQKGIIHRDIKPSNVLIAQSEGKPTPKVIDFGVAKVTERRLTERNLSTHHGMLVGTLEYMSPEQAEPTALGIDTRSDIYSLGALLYELLAGTTPLSGGRSNETSYVEMLRLIREEEPLRPSECIAAADTIGRIAAQRRTDPAKLTSVVRGELDWIVMKALEKDRARRYETASELAADVLHYLADEPVLACPPSAGYRFRKFARRNRGAMAAAVAVAILMLLTTITLAVSNSLIRQEQARTKEERVRAERAQELAQLRVKEIQQGLQALKDANGWLERGRWYITLRRWDDAHEAFTKAIQLRPDHGSAWNERGNLYAHLSLWDLAVSDFAHEIGLRPPDTTLRWYQLALLSLHEGDLESYRQTCRQMRERFHGTAHLSFVEEVIRANTLAPEPDADLSWIVEASERVATIQPWSSYSLYLLGSAHYRAGQYEQAIRRLRESLSATDWPNRLLSHSILAMAYHRVGRSTEARQSLDEVASILEQWTQQRYSTPSGDWVIHLGADAVWPVQWWDVLECQYYYGEAKRLIDGMAAPDDPRQHILRARSFAGLRLNSKAEPEYAAALRLRPQDQQIQLESHRNRGYTCIGAERWDEAASEFGKACELSPDDAHLWRFCGLAHFAAGNMDAYRRTCSGALQRFQHSTDTRVAGNVIVLCVVSDDAVPDMSLLLPLARVAAPWGHDGAYALGEIYYRCGKYEEAIQSLNEAAKTFRPGAIERLFMAMAHYRLGHVDQARQLLSESGRWIDEANHHAGDDLSGTQPAWGSWSEPVVCRILYREATDLLETPLQFSSNKDIETTTSP